jgi:hypothetical protein
MSTPGFTAEAATYSRAAFFQMNAAKENKSSASAVTMAVPPPHKCYPHQDTCCCPKGWFCSEPGDYPRCHCLQCTRLD